VAAAAAAAAGSGECGGPAAATAALYSLTRVLQAVSYPPLLAAVTAALVGSPAAAAAARAALWEPTAHQPPYTWPPQLPPDVARAVEAQTTRSCMDDSSGGHGGGIAERGDEDGDCEDAAMGSGRGKLEEGRREFAVRRETANDAAVAGSGSLRAALLHYLSTHDTPLGGGVVLMLVTLMQNKEVPEALLEEVCILRQCTKQVSYGHRPLRCPSGSNPMD
jgi:hypothetical protein